MNSGPWVAALEVARHSVIVKDSVYRWREHRGMPVRRMGRRWQFMLAKIDQWVRASGADEACKEMMI